MTTRKLKPQAPLGPAAVQIFAVNDRINQLLIEHLHPAAWKAKAPGNARTIAAIFTHMHNVRTKWIRLTAPHLKIPRLLNRTLCTPRQACSGINRERRSLRRDARGSARRRWRPRQKVSQRRLGAALASRPGNALLHAYSRSPPSRTGVHAGASAGISAAAQDRVRNLELGKALERVRVCWRPRPCESFQGTSRAAQYCCLLVR